MMWRKVIDAGLKWGTVKFFNEKRRIRLANGGSVVNMVGGEKTVKKVRKNGIKVGLGLVLVSVFYNEDGGKKMPTCGGEDGL